MDPDYLENNEMHLACLALLERSSYYIEGDQIRYRELLKSAREFVELKWAENVALPHITHAVRLYYRFINPSRFADHFDISSGEPALLCADCQFELQLIVNRRVSAVSDPRWDYLEQSEAHYNILIDYAKAHSLFPPLPPQQLTLF